MRNFAVLDGIDHGKVAADAVIKMENWLVGVFS